jgi:replication factor C small subunit
MNIADKNSVPNLLVCGPSGSGKTTLTRKFINDLYHGDKTLITKNVMWVNCAYGKGIKFIRENLKFYAKTNLSANSPFKIIVLQNSEHLTCDAQSALRRSIEQFSFNTRFFFLTSDKFKLLKPILSRLSEIAIQGKENLHVKAVNAAFPNGKLQRERNNRLNAKLKSVTRETNLFKLSDELVEEAFSALDLAKYVREHEMDTMFKYEWLMFYSNLRENFRVENMLLFILLYAYVHRSREMLI